MQPNLTQDERFRTSAKNEIMDRYVSISDRATSPEIQGVKDVTHLFWPESAFPFFLEREADMLARISRLISPNAYLITGAARYDDPKPNEPVRYYNSIRVVGPDGGFVATYDKVHLVPFGEYLPFQHFLESLGLEQLTRQRGGFTAGAKLRALNIPGLPPAHLLRGDLSRRGDARRPAARMDAQCFERRVVRQHARPLSAPCASKAARGRGRLAACSCNEQWNFRDH